MNTRIAAVVLALSSVFMPLAAHAGTRPEFVQESPAYAQPALGVRAEAIAQPAALAHRMGGERRGNGRFEQHGRFEGRQHGGRMEQRHGGFEQGRRNGRR